MSPTEKEDFNLTYKSLLDQLNEKKRAGIKFDFNAELNDYEHTNEIEQYKFFKVGRPLPLGVVSSLQQLLKECMHELTYLRAAVAPRSRVPSHGSATCCHRATVLLDDFCHLEIVRCRKRGSFTCAVFASSAVRS